MMAASASAAVTTRENDGVFIGSRCLSYCICSDRTEQSSGFVSIFLPVSLHRCYLRQFGFGSDSMVMRYGGWFPPETTKLAKAVA
jgi:hypothetical protein